MEKMWSIVFVIIIIALIMTAVFLTCVFLNRVWIHVQPGCGQHASPTWHFSDIPNATSGYFTHINDVIILNFKDKEGVVYKKTFKLESSEVIKPKKKQP